MPDPFGRKLLPADVQPRWYDLQLEPKFEEEKFWGRVRIGCVVLTTTRTIGLNSKHISITEASVNYSGNIVKVDQSLQYSEVDETIQLKTDFDLVSGDDFVIDLKFFGDCGSKCIGLYQSQYTDGAGVEHKVAATSMEPTYARQVFPCFDEPALKAEFVVSAVVDKHFECYSNMPEEKTESMTDKTKIVTFKKTPPMSTYLLALVVGDFARVTCEKRRIPVSILCPLGREQETEFALTVASDGLQFFEDAFGPMPLPKLDLAAIPGFSGGGQENWGLIICRTSALLLDHDDSALDRKKNTARVVFHEISHMWFGDLVTMKYWDGLWLKEGFANLMSWIALDKFFPSWTIWDHYVANELQAALELDGLKSTRAVEQVVKDPSDAKQMYDKISYKKGCCLLKMISNDLSEADFMKGANHYLNSFKYDSTESDGLWQTLENATGMPLTERMRVWTKEPGFPVVRVSEETQNVTGEKVLLLTQNRFIASGSRQDETETDTHAETMYPLKISVRSTEGITSHDMVSRQTTITAPTSPWFKINADHDGFYLTAYSTEALSKLVVAAAHDELSLRDCIGLSYDVRRLVACGENKTSDLLDLVCGFRGIGGYLVWESLERNMGTVLSTFKFENEAIKNGLQHLCKDMFGAKAKELGWDKEGEDDTTTAFKSSMFYAGGIAGDPDIISASRALFRARLGGDENAIPAFLRYEVFGVVAKHGGKEELEALFDIWKTSKNDDERYLALESMGRASSPALTQWVLDLSLTDDVKSEDVFIMLWLVNASQHGAVELWNWIKTNWDKLQQKVTEKHLNIVLELTLNGLGTDEQISDVRSFFSEKSTSQYSMVLAGRLEDMEIRRNWRQRDKDDVAEWLKIHGYST